MKNKGGRPPKLTDVVKLQQSIDIFFDNESKPTLSGLALFLGMDRETLRSYSKKEKFFGTIKNARDRMMKIYEQKLLYGSGSPVGVIFALKNFGWQDKQDIEHSGRIQWGEEPPK